MVSENVYFDESLNAIIAVFDGILEKEEFQLRANEITVLLKKHGINKVLNNTSKLEAVTVENQDWTEQVWFPKAIEAGLKHFAFLMPSDIVGEVSMQQTNKKAEEDSPVNIKYFGDEKEAKEWLLKQ